MRRSWVDGDGMGWDGRIGMDVVVMAGWKDGWTTGKDPRNLACKAAYFVNASACIRAKTVAIYVMMSKCRVVHFRFAREVR
jgi:hypothetical protein